MDLEISMLADNWRADRFGSLKFVTDIPSDLGAIMTEIVGEHRLILCLFSLPKISECEPNFQRLRILNWR